MVNGYQKFCYSRAMLIIFTVLIMTTSVYVSTIPAKPVYAQLASRTICLEGNANRVLTILSFGLAPDAAQGFFYSFNIINPSGRLQEGNVRSGVASVFFSLNAGMPNPGNQPITSAVEGPGRYTIQVFQVTGGSSFFATRGSATLIGTINIDLPFSPCVAPPVPPGRLTVVLQVRGGPGSPPNIPDVSAFRLQVVGNTQAEPFTAVPGGNTVTINPGFFIVNQLTSIPDYTMSFSGDCDPTGRGTMTSGASLVCTVTNTYTQPSEGTGILRVFKEVINDNLGLRQPGDFAIRVTGGSGVGGTFAPPNNLFAGIDQSHGGTTITLRPGKYSVIEEPSSIIQGPNAYYSVSYSPECAGDIAAGQTKTCIVTNDDIRQPGVLVLSATHLDIVKAFIPPPQRIPRFSVDVVGTSNNVHTNLNVGVGPAQRETVTIQTGTYRVVERPVPDGYAAIYSDECTGTLTGEPVPSRTCTITNVAITLNTTSGIDIGFSIDPEVYRCLQDPSCISRSHIPQSLVPCLQNPECFRTLTLDTSTGLTTQINLTKKELITKYNVSEPVGPIHEPSLNAFNQTLNATNNNNNTISTSSQTTVFSKDSLTKT
jgi:hypothetical protein